ncbi:hypothetical protein MRA01_28960 [Methylobacterium radiotolerans]|nr:hypothetical protein MRA01_28960 [Methylobacterium radiotolerans]
MDRHHGKADSLEPISTLWITVRDVAGGAVREFGAPEPAISGYADGDHASKLAKCLADYKQSGTVNQGGPAALARNKWYQKNYLCRFVIPLNIGLPDLLKKIIAGGI